MKFIVTYLTPNGTRGQKVVDAYDNIEAAQKVKEELPDVRIMEILKQSHET